MYNDRPIEDRYMQEVLNMFYYACDRYDLAGGIYLVNREEMGFAYALPATWNAFIQDSSTPLGFRIRASTKELGKERAKELIEGTAHIAGSMIDFGDQTRIWGKDLIRLLKGAGIEITRQGRNIPHLDKL